MGASAAGGGAASGAVSAGRSRKRQMDRPAHRRQTFRTLDAITVCSWSRDPRRPGSASVTVARESAPASAPDRSGLAARRVIVDADRPVRLAAPSLRAWCGSSPSSSRAPSPCISCGACATSCASVVIALFVALTLLPLVDAVDARVRVPRAPSSWRSTSHWPGACSSPARSWCRAWSSRSHGSRATRRATRTIYAATTLPPLRRPLPHHGQHPARRARRCPAAWPRRRARSSTSRSRRSASSASSSRSSRSRSC